MKIFIAKQLIKYYHRNQTDLGGSPYINHLMRVYQSTKKSHSKSHQIVALLHDIYEDTSCSPMLIKFLFGIHVHRAVLSLTKVSGLEYDAYIRMIKKNPIARVVKQLDLLDNMNLERLSKVTSNDIKRNQKYQRALNSLFD